TMDFEFFRCNILPPGNYAMWLKTDRSEPAELYVPYVLVYDTFSAICKEQQKIVENQEDAIALSAVFRLLPRLTELGLRFCQTLVQEHWWGVLWTKRWKDILTGIIFVSSQTPLRPEGTPGFSYPLFTYPVLNFLTIAH
ncbi:unnamed protein product, partial [Penicillium salamii]